MDLALIKALARAHRFRQLLEDGEVASVEALARRFGLDRGHAGLTLNLAFLSPTITRAIVCGEQPPGLVLTQLLHADIPPSWRLQDGAIRHIAQRPLVSSVRQNGQRSGRIFGAKPAQK